MDDFLNHLSCPCLLGEMRSYNSAEVPYCWGNAIDQDHLWFCLTILCQLILGSLVFSSLSYVIYKMGILMPADSVSQDYCEMFPRSHPISADFHDSFGHTTW